MGWNRQGPPQTDRPAPAVQPSVLRTLAVARKAEVVTNEPPRWLPVLALAAAALATPAAFGWIGGEIENPCGAAVVPWMGLIKMFDRMPLAIAFVVTAVSIVRYRFFRWPVAVALLVVSIALVRVGVASYQAHTKPVLSVDCSK